MAEAARPKCGCVTPRQEGGTMTTLPSPDNSAALDFLKKMYPDGPWVLTAIRSNPKSIETRTFGPNAEGACLDWMKTQIEEGKRSVGFRQGRAQKAAESQRDTAVSP
jgi:hypothetical protein